MKKCPNCNAQIQDDARFCLYCMTSLEKKQPIESEVANRKWLLYSIAAALVLSILTTCVVLLAQGNRSAYPSDGANTPSTSFSSKEEHRTTLQTQNHTTAATQNTQSSESRTTVQKTHAAPSNHAIISTTSRNISTGNNKTSNPSQSAVKTTTILPDNTPVTYTYRDAQYGDDFSVGADTENCVVITGVSTPSANGIYTIPDTLGGKKVVAIMASAFCGDGISATVKKVIVPSSVKTIWNYAFSNCYNLTDIYFRGNAIYVEAQAFAAADKRNGTLTIHCAATCSDRNFRYYKSTASDYDAVYQEWNG